MLRVAAPIVQLNVGAFRMQVESVHPHYGNDWTKISTSLDRTLCLLTVDPELLISKKYEAFHSFGVGSLHVR